MKILYGVSGEGAGHSTRAKVIIDYLLSQGHKVEIVSYDKGYKNLSRYFNVTKVSGLHLIYKQNKVKYISTLLNTLIHIPEVKQSVDKVTAIVKTFQPDLILTDFEPTSCIVGLLNSIPVVSIDNQHIITNCKLSYPKKYLQDAQAAKVAIRFLITKANYYLVTSFVPCHTNNSKTILIPPILRNEVLEMQSIEDSHVLVYFTSDYKEAISILKKINKTFYVYGLLNTDRQDGNIIYKKPSIQGFLNDLSSCHCIIANAGFSLISEALYFQKPYFALPVQSQFEQILNAYYIDKLGLGKFSDKLTLDILNTFFQNYSSYKKELLNYKQLNNHVLFKEIDRILQTIA